MNGFDDRWGDPSSFRERKSDFGEAGGGWGAGGDVSGGADTNGGWGGWDGGKKAKTSLEKEAGGWGEWKSEEKRSFPARSRRDLDSVDVSPEDFRGLPPFEKNFYVEHPNVASLTENDVAAYRKKRE
eukprot:c32849_g1_i1 orf=3-380(-)